MISYKPLWEIMGKYGYTTYTLRKKANIGGGTVENLKKTNLFLHIRLIYYANFFAVTCPKLLNMLKTKEKTKKTSKGKYPIKQF